MDDPIDDFEILRELARSEYDSDPILVVRRVTDEAKRALDKFAELERVCVERDQALAALDEIDHYTYGWTFNGAVAMVDRIRLKAREFTGTVTPPTWGAAAASERGGIALSALRKVIFTADEAHMPKFLSSQGAWRCACGETDDAGSTESYREHHLGAIEAAVLALLSEPTSAEIDAATVAICIDEDGQCEHCRWRAENGLRAARAVLSSDPPKETTR